MGRTREQLSNEQILSRIDGAVKTMTMANMGQSILLPSQFNRFIRKIRETSVILREARFVRMDRHERQIDRIGFTGRVLRAGSDASDVKRELAESEYAQPMTATRKLTARELQAVAPLGDDTLYTNIEQAQLETTLRDLFSEAAGFDLAEYALLADTAITFVNDQVLSKTDAWLKNAGNKIYGVANPDPDTTGPLLELPRDFNPDFNQPFGSPEQVGAGTNQDEKNTNVEKMFQKAMLAVPAEHRQNFPMMKFYVGFEVFDAYHETLRRRKGTLDSDAQTKRPMLDFKGIPVEYEPALERSKPDGPQGAGRVGLLTTPTNAVWGVFKDIQVEPDRLPKKRRTDFVLTFWGDADFEDETGAVAIFLDRMRPRS